VEAHSLASATQSALEHAATCIARSASATPYRLVPAWLSAERLIERRYIAGTASRVRAYPAQGTNLRKSTKRSKVEAFWRWALRSFSLFRRVPSPRAVEQVAAVLEVPGVPVELGRHPAQAQAEALAR
jgi:hypothetical protein